MKKSRLIRLSLLAVFLACMLFWHGCSVRYTKRFETMTHHILANSSSWQRLLSDAMSEQSVSEEHATKLLSENSGFVQSIEYLPEYPGIYLVAKQMFPSKEGILISEAEIEPISLERNTGIEIEHLGSSENLLLYRLHYYWD